MNRVEVLSMARKVKLGAALAFDYRGSFEAMTAPEQDRLVQLEQFAALVAAAEREACAKLADESADDCENGGHTEGQMALDLLSDAIRARATTPKD